MMCALAPQTPAENVAQLLLKPLSCTLVESIRRTQSPILRRYPRCNLDIKTDSRPANIAAGRDALAVDSAELDTVQPPSKNGGDGRDKPGHDESGSMSSQN